MNLAVLCYQFEADHSDDTFPACWPTTCIELGGGTTLPGENWILMTKAELAEHREEFQEDYNTWWAANQPQDPPPEE